MHAERVQGSSECSGGGKTLEKFLSALDDDLAEQYRIERWHSGTTGKGHNCTEPKTINQEYKHSSSAIRNF